MRPFYVLLLAGSQPTPTTGFLSAPSVPVSRSVKRGSQRFRSEPTCRNLRNRGFRRDGQLSGLSPPRALRRTNSSSSSNLSIAASSCSRILRARGDSTHTRRWTTAVGSWKVGGRGGGGAPASRVTAVCASRMPTARHARAAALTSEEGSSVPIAASSNSRVVPSARIADPTAVAHEYLRDFLGMTEEVRSWRRDALRLCFCLRCLWLHLFLLKTCLVSCQ